MARMIHVPFSRQGINILIKNYKFIQENLPKVRNEYVSRSLDYIEKRAKYYIQQTTGNSDWYVLSHTLESSFVKNVVEGTLINMCKYAIYVEYGTGIIGKGTHPDSGDYQYDANGHGADGWFFFDDEGVLHWTQGMEAHMFLYNAVNDFLKYESGKILKEVLRELMGGV